MSGVSTRALAVLLDTASDRGIPLEPLTKGLPIPKSKPYRLFERIDWDVFATVCERLSDRLGDRQAIIEFGEALAPNKSLSLFRLVGSTFYDPRELYMVGAKWLGPSVFPMLDAELQELPGGVFVQRLVLQDGHRDCPSFFLFMAGFLRTAPVQWGSPKSEVDLDLEPFGATIYIHPHDTQLGWAARCIRWMRGRRTSRLLMDELAGQQSDIQESYREVRLARDRIAAQARELEQVNLIGRELSQHIELDQVARVLTLVLLEDLAFEGAELEVILPDHPDTDAADPLDANSRATQSQEVLTPIKRSAGRMEGPPSKRFPLKAASGSIGTLSVWNPSEEADSDRSEGLESTRDSVVVRLLPWISIALDNARTYRQLESHAADLQSRVLERTARLLTTNHHLVREIEERKQATDALLVSEAQLRASERLASIGTLAAGIAHEINNPVGSILAAAQLALLVQDEEDAREQVTESLTDIVGEAKRCGEIVRSVLQFSRDERTEKWDCRLQDIVHRAARLTETYTAEFNASLRSVVPDEPIWVHVNPIQIEQALVNLVRNAIEAEGREILVVVEALESEGLVMIEVRDDGSGLSKDDQVRLFEPFYTTKRSDGGTGLGLSVVHGIVKEHGGTLKAAPQSEGGASVLIELPTVPAPPKSLEDKPDPE